MRASLLFATGLPAPLAQAQGNYATPYFFTTIAGATTTGSSDGTGDAARFNAPQGIAIDAAGTIYVADTNNHTIRKIVHSTQIIAEFIGQVTTLAGRAGVSGPASADGSGSAPRFNLPRGLAVDSAGNVYVADTGNHAIRKISPGGVVATLAGGAPGAVDGPGEIARLFLPSGVAVDAAGNVYVADTANGAIRKITPGGVVSTLAGALGTFGSIDGTGAAARFSSPRGVAVDGSGNVYVADRDNHSIRKVSPTGVVTTLAGSLGPNPGSTDGTGNAARFNQPHGVTVDGDGNVYVAEQGNHTIRKITPAGVVTTLAGLTLAAGNATKATGGAVRFSSPQAIAVDGDGNLCVADTDNHAIRLSVSPPRFTLHPMGQTVLPGGALFFTAAAKSNAGIFDVRWEKNGTMGFLPFAASWNSAYTVMTTELFQANVGASHLGDYTVIATNMAGSTTSNVATLAIPISDAGRLTNLSIRTNAGTGAQTLIVGVVVGGASTTGTKPLLIRGVGPTLGVFGVPGFLVDPTMSVFSGTTVVSSNDNWNGDAQIAAIGTQVGAFAYGTTTSRDAALYSSALIAGAYTVQVSGVGGTTGITLAEIYDATPVNVFLVSTPRLINVSARTQVGTGADILITGFTIGGTTPKTLLIRAVGPTLGVFGVTGVLADPRIELFSGTTVIQSNDNWGGGVAIPAAAASVGAFALDAASRDAVLLVTLDPGSYTAQVSGVGNTTGVALVEIYDVP